MVRIWLPLFPFNLRPGMMVSRPSLVPMARRPSLRLQTAFSTNMSPRALLLYLKFRNFWLFSSKTLRPLLVPTQIRPVLSRMTDCTAMSLRPSAVV